MIWLLAFAVAGIIFVGSSGLTVRGRLVAAALGAAIVGAAASRLIGGAA